MDNTTLVTGTTPERLTEKILLGVRKEIDTLKLQYKTKEPEDWIDRKSTAKLLNISMTTLHQWVIKGFLNAYKLGNRTYFSRKEINEKLQQSKIQVK